MSSEPKPWARKAQLVFVGALLAVHVVWIGVHMSLAADKKINPWKLGGYAMYTTPHPNARAHVFIFDEGARRWAEIQRSENKFSSFAFDRANALHVFRCGRPSEAALIGFMDENPHLRNRPLTIAISETVFERYPVKTGRTLATRIEIAWGKDNTFAYRGKTCDETYQGQIAYTPPPSG